MARQAMHRTRRGVVRTMLGVVLGIMWLGLPIEVAAAQDPATAPATLQHAPTGAWGVLTVHAQALIEDLGIRPLAAQQGKELRPELDAVESVHLFLLPTEPLCYLTAPPRWGAIVHLTPEGLPVARKWSEGMTEFRCGDVTAHQKPGLAMALVGDGMVALAGDADGLESVVDACRSGDGTLRAGLSGLLGDYSEGTVHGAFLLPEPLGELASEGDLEGASRWVRGVRSGAFCLDIGGGLDFRSALLLDNAEDALEVSAESAKVIEWMKPQLEAGLGGMWEELARPLLVALESVRTRVDGKRFMAELYMGPEIFVGGDDFVAAADVASCLLLMGSVLSPPAAPRRLTSPPAPPAAAWDGFGGVEWGGSLATREDMSPAGQDETGMMVEYSRRGDGVSVGGVELKGLRYFACEDQFCRVVADL
ncbi:MAG: hypothetical protein AMK73_02645, partial [Planctomycetes bacterium SM23_32]